jgi:tetratricopeptide (TPR) repeat protein
MGLVGLLTYLALFGAVFWTCWKLMQRGGEWRLYGMGFTAMTVAYIIHNAFIFDTSTNFIVFFTLAGFLSSLAVQSSGSGVNTKKPAHRPAPLGAGRLSVLLILLIPALIVMARTNIRPTQANYATTRGIIAGWQGQFAEAMSKYEEAVAYETFGVYEERHRLAQYLLEVNIQIEGVPDIFRQALEFAISEVEKNILLNEQDYLPHLYLARMHIILGQNDPDSDHNAIALSHTDRALEISPTFVRTYFEIAQAYLNRKEFVQAYEWFAKAQQLNPEVGITYWYLGIVRAQLGDPEGAIEFINEAVQKGYTLSQEEVERVINIYLQLGDLDSVVALLEQLIERAPDRPDYWASLAAAHIQAGNNEDAIYAIRQAMELDEDYRAEGERLLQELGAE